MRVLGAAAFQLSVFRAHGIYALTSRAALIILSASLSREFIRRLRAAKVMEVQACGGAKSPTSNPFYLDARLVWPCSGDDRRIIRGARAAAGNLLPRQPRMHRCSRFPPGSVMLRGVAVRS